MAKKSFDVNATIENASTYDLTWVKVDWADASLNEGVLSRGIGKTDLHFRWPDLPDAKLTFIDEHTRKPYSIELSLVDAYEKIQSGAYRNVTIRILSYEKAEVICSK